MSFSLLDTISKKLIISRSLETQINQALKSRIPLGLKNNSLKITRKRKGSRLIYRTLFTLKQMLAFLSQAIERKYQVVEGIYLPSG